MEKDLNQSETSADQAAVLKNFTELSGFGISADIKIFRSFAKEKVSDSSTNQVGEMACVTQTVEYLQRLPVNFFS